MNVVNDLTGCIINNWKVIEYRGKRKWLCECQCDKHTQKEVAAYSLTSGRSKSCGRCNKSEIKVGDKFGEWEVIELKKDYKALCRCSCNKEKEVNIYTLLDGRSTGCGHTKNKDRIIDMTNETYGDLTPIQYISDGTWLCRCSCGKLKVAKRAKLLSGVTHSCGHDTDRGFINIKGQRFGKLVAVEYMGKKLWKCQCDCEPNKFVIVRGANLRNGSTKSCGCLTEHYLRVSKEEIIKLIEEFKNKYNRKPFTNELANMLNTSVRTAQSNIEKYNLRPYLNNSFSSAYEREIAEMFPTAILGSRSIIPPYELDIYIPERKLAIEFNGTYWHSSINKDMNYHQNKTIECAKKGIRLIHIFEYEWVHPQKREIIKNLLKDTDKKRFFARKTYIRKITKTECSEFLNRYHLQGYTASSIMLGCFIKNEDNQESLLGVMTFSPPRFDKKYDFEIVRLCWRDDVIVTGGTEKLFKHFIKVYKPSSVLTYADISKFTGNVYTRIGFKPASNSITKPNYVWVSNHNEEVLPRYKTQKKKLLKMRLGTEDQTEDEIMSNLGYMKVYDSGNIKLEWTSNQA